MFGQCKTWLAFYALACTVSAVPAHYALAQTTSTGTQQFVVTYGELKPSYDAHRQAKPQLDQLTRLASQYGAQYFTVQYQIDRPNLFTLIQVWRDAASYAGFTGASNVQKVFANLGSLLIAPLDERDGNLVLPQ